jgi:catechol 2,3-dioxygenase-like lactoylglutathione lyase family enzyme
MPTTTTRVHLALNVEDVEAAAAFYSKLFGVDPHKQRPGYANFVVEDPPLKLVLFESAEAAGMLNHLGIEAPSAEAVAAADERFRAAGLETRSITDDLCCHAVQDKVFVTAPDVPLGWWEYYAVTDDDPVETEARPASQCCAAPADTTAGCC